MKTLARIALLVVAAWAAGGPAIAKAAHAEKPGALHHILVGSAVSFDLPDDWASCSPDINAELGLPARVAAIQALCVTQTKPDAWTFVNLERPGHLLLSLQREGKPTAIGLYVGAPEEVMAQVFSSCNKAAYGGPTQHCVVRATTVDRHDAIVGDTEVGGTFPTGGRFYVVHVPGGNMFMKFVWDLPAADAARAAVEKIMASTHVVPDPAPPAGSVVLTPVPGLSVTMPRGWLACDPANAALLGDASDIFGVRALGCGTDRTGAEARFVSLVGPRVELIDMASKVSSIDPEKFAAKLTPGGIVRDHDSDCTSADIALLPPAAVVSDCTITIGAVAGHPAEIVALTSTLMQPGTGVVFHDRSRMMIFLNNGRLVVLAVASFGLVDAPPDGAADAIASTVTLQ